MITGKIQLLENIMINKIAAGEVVERPVSVVKELVENSIDAGASQITIEVSDGGISYIRVTDNGKGIPRDQVATAFLRHATSKIVDMDDLENVLTLGFRGEALSSISSVAQVEITTKTANDITGLNIEINGGIIEKEKETGGVEGTSIVVRNLFYNTPARRKFLKKPSTETGYISDMVNRFALGRPDISFVFINNSNIVLQTRGKGDLKTSILQVYGKETAKNLIEFSYEKEIIKVKGFLGRPEISRGNRNYGHLFINGRFIKSDLVQSAVEQAYKTRVFGGKFPVFVINLSVDPAFVDVNVHPTKLEVRFSNEELVYNTLLEGAEEALKSHVLVPQVSLKEKEMPSFHTMTNNTVYRPTQKQHSISDVIYSNSYKNSYLNETVFPYTREKESCSDNSDNSKNFEVILPLSPKEINYPKKEENETIISILDSVSQKSSEELNKDFFEETNEFKHNAVSSVKKNIDVNDIEPFFKTYKIIGQLFNTYWLVEQGVALYVIDQHAAHERVMYEQLINGLVERQTNSQRLLEPIVLNLGSSETVVVNENIVLLENMGFYLEDFGHGKYAIVSVPFIIKGEADGRFFMNIVDKLSNISTSVKDVYEAKTEAIAMASCKAAIKGNNKLSYVEAKELIDKVLSLENPFSCPHGRPTIIEITKYEVEKLFKRV